MQNTHWETHMTILLIVRRFLWGNRLLMILVFVQIAITIAISLNGLAIFLNQFGIISRDSGIDEPHSFKVDTFTLVDNWDIESMVLSDLDAIRSHPAVIGAISSNYIPHDRGWTGVSVRSEWSAEGISAPASLVMADQSGAEVLDLVVTKGRWFESVEVDLVNLTKQIWSAKVIITENLENHLFPGKPALGRTIFLDNGKPVEIIGIVDKFIGNHFGEKNVVFMPQIRVAPEVRYLVRTVEGKLDSTMREIRTLLENQQNQLRIVREPMAVWDLKLRTYGKEAKAATLMFILICGLLTLSAFGVYAVNMYTVTSQLDVVTILHALGFRASKINSLFQIQSLIVLVLSLILGVAGGAFLNSFLSQAYEIPTLTWINVLSICVPASLICQASSLMATNVGMRQST